MDMVREREEIDKANRYALDEIEERKLELQNKEKCLMRDNIKNSKKPLRIKELAEKMARIEVCKRLENKVQSIIFNDNMICDHMKEHIK